MLTGKTYLAVLCFGTAAFAQTLPALATLDVPYQVRYALNITSEAGGIAANPAGVVYPGGLDSVFNVTNDGANGASPFGSGLANGSTGNICANLYAFDNQEEMVWCCSCLITPDETISFFA